MRTPRETQVKFEEKFWELANPKSNCFRKWLSREEIRDFFHPLTEKGLAQSEIVVEYLVKHALAHR